jgi:hypothetical protein
MSRNAPLNLSLAAAVALGLMAAPAMAEVQMFKGDLAGGAETPPSASKGIGSIAVALDPKTRKISWKGYYVGLQGSEIKAHFHGPAKAGEKAAPILPVEAVEETFQGSATLDAQQVKQLEDGQWYFNIHSSKHPEGELRGQLSRVR